MGSRLPIMLGALVVARIAAAQGNLPTADLAKQGNDQYAAGDYAGAAATFQKALQLEPNNVEYKFKLAQSLRQSGHCDQALPIYKGLAANPAPNQKADIDAGITECTPKAPPPTVAPQQDVERQPTPAKVEEPAASSGGAANINPRQAAMLMGSGALVGAGIVLFWAAHTHSGDADAAVTVKDHDRIAGRSTAEYIMGGVALAGGIALGLYTMNKIRHSNESTSVAIVPRTGGGQLVLERSW